MRHSANNLVKLLIVEDEESWRRVMLRWLGPAAGGEAFEVVPAETLQAACECASRAHFDAAILDLNLPDTSGIRTVARFHEAAPSVPVVIVSGEEDETLVREAMALGAEDYLIKGRITRDLLVRAVHYAMGRKRAEVALQQSEARIREFSHELLSVREEEKRRISASLHHDVGSLAVGLSARLNAVEDDLRHGRIEAALQSVAASQTLFQHAIAGLKELAIALRPPDLDILGLVPALRQHLMQFSLNTPLRIRFWDATQGRSVSQDTATVLFRIIQESLTNVVKHAQATRVLVWLEMRDGGVRAAIRDNGIGIDAGAHTTPAGFRLGLRAMRELAESQGGTLEIRSGRRNGTTIVVKLPAGGKLP